MNILTTDMCSVIYVKVIILTTLKYDNNSHVYLINLFISLIMYLKEFQRNNSYN